eukprot:6824626-Prorocentrum_lima.AAC.1
MGANYRRGGVFMDPNLDPQLPPEGGSVKDMVWRYHRHACPPPPGLLYSCKGDARTGELEGKELHAWGGGRVRASKGGG